MMVLDLTVNDVHGVYSLIRQISVSRSLLFVGFRLQKGAALRADVRHIRSLLTPLRNSDPKSFDEDNDDMAMGQNWVPQ